MRKKRDFECSMVVSARGAGLSMSETADVLKFSHAIASRIYTAVNDIKKKRKRKGPSSNHLHSHQISIQWSIFGNWLEQEITVL